jgi:hypothetical protein
MNWKSLLVTFVSVAVVMFIVYRVPQIKSIVVGN